MGMGMSFFLAWPYKSTMHPILNEGSYWYMGIFSLFSLLFIHSYFILVLGTWYTELALRVSVQGERAKRRAQSADCNSGLGTGTLDLSLAVRSVGSEQSLYKSCN